MLENIHSPKDLKQLHIDELDKLSDEIRTKIIHSTLKNGGHLASNLGAVELTVALHYVFDAPEDKIIFDVGHQCYTHKLLTGRQEKFERLRKKDGISGFPNHLESEYDVFDAGHSSTAISAALGMARARDRKGENYHVVAVVGDGAIGGGMAFEAMNDAGSSPDTRLIILLNDNEMSISENVGALSGHFSKLRAARGYMRSKKRVKTALKKINHSGKLVSAVSHLRNTLRYFLMGETLFDTMGIKYLGPINGHSVKDMINILRKAKECTGPVIIHAITCKGCGYEKAEQNPEHFHGVSPSGGGNPARVSFAGQLGQTLSSAAREDDSVCAVTAGMTYNTGLSAFAEHFPNRFFDTGIAEQHALTMAAGLAKGGLKPFVVIYATFLQRGLDQIFHDICLQQLPVTVCADHAGLVGDDGATHQGVFDLGFLNAMPGLTVLAPRDAAEFDRMLRFTQKNPMPAVIRYPKGSAPLIPSQKPFDTLQWDVLREGENGTLITFGACVQDGIAVAEKLGLCLIDARVLKPLDTAVLDRIAAQKIFVLEDNAPAGGLCEAILHYYAQKGTVALVTGFALQDGFVAVGSVQEQKEDNGIDVPAVTEKIRHEIG